MKLSIKDRRKEGLFPRAEEDGNRPARFAHPNYSRTVVAVKGSLRRAKPARRDRSGPFRKNRTDMRERGLSEIATIARDFVAASSIGIMDVSTDIDKRDGFLNKIVAALALNYCILRLKAELSAALHTQTKEEKEKA